MPMDDLKPSRNEDEYFARVDADLRKELRAKADAERAAQSAAALHKCPRCGAELVEKRSASVVIDECPAGHGMWLDKGELEILSAGQRESTGFVGTLLGFMR